MSEVKVLAIGDLHFRRDAIPEGRVLSDAVLSRLTPDLDIAIVMGDVLDRFGDIKTSPLTLAVSFLNSLSSKIRTFLIIGNHDLPHKCCDPEDNHPFTALKYWGSRMTVVDKPIKVEVGKISFVLAPYYEPGMLIPQLDSHIPNWKQSHVVFGHQELHCVSYGGVQSQGDKWEDNFPLAIMGHIHDYCTPLENVVYIGAPMQRTFAEAADKTISHFTFSIQESRDQEAKFRWSQKRLDLGIIKLVHLKIRASEFGGLQLPENCKIKLTISGTKDELANIRLQTGVLKSMGVKVNFETIRDERSGTNLTSQRISRSYRTLLATEASKDLELKELFGTIFGSS